MPDKLSIKEFASKIKSQYPQYSDVDDFELVDKIITKYPTYRDKVDLKKKEPTTPDSKIPTEPLLPSGEEAKPKPRVAGLHQTVGIAKGNAIDFYKNIFETKETEASDFANQGYIDDLEKNKAQVEAARDKQRQDINEAINQGVYGDDVPPYIQKALSQEYNPIVESLEDERESIFGEAKVAFKEHYLEKNPEVKADLESDDEDKSEAAQEEINKAWTMQPSVLSDEERRKNELRKSSVFTTDKGEFFTALESIYNAVEAGMDERDFNLKMAKEIAFADDEQAKRILELEYKRELKNRQLRAVDAPEAGMLSPEGFAKMFGTQAVPIVSTIAAGTVAGPLGIAYSGADAGATSYGAAFRSTYIQAKDEGKTDQEAYDMARKQAYVEASTGFVEGVAGAATTKLKPFAKLFDKVGNKLIRPLVETARVGANDMTMDAGVAGVAQVINNGYKISQGLDVGLFDGVTDEMLGEVIFSAGMKIPGTVKTAKDFRNYVKSLPPKDRQKIIDQVVDAKGSMDAKFANQKANQYLKARRDESVAEGNADLTIQIDNDPEAFLEQEKKRLQAAYDATTNDAIKKELKRNIDVADAFISNLSQYTIDVDGEKSKLTRAEMLERIDDPAFVESVAVGETDLEIKNDKELEQRLWTKIDELTKTEEDAIQEQETQGEADIERRRQEELDEQKFGDTVIQPKLERDGELGFRNQGHKEIRNDIVDKLIGKERKQAQLLLNQWINTDLTLSEIAKKLEEKLKN
jgi:hypothetical protein